MINLSINGTVGFTPPIQYMSIFDILFQCWGWLGMILFFPDYLLKFFTLHKDYRIWIRKWVGIRFYLPHNVLCNVPSPYDRAARNLGASKMVVN
jgi:hypothetical protein